MKRKVVQQGPKTLGISLPSKWIRKYSITKGSELDITEIYGRLIIARTRSLLRKQESVVNIDDDDKRYIRLLINNAYRGGTDRLKVNFSANKVYEVIKYVTSHFLLGFEITKRGRDYCIIENIAEPEEGKYETILRRIFLNILDSSALTVKSIESQSHSNYEAIIESTYQVGKYDNFCKRNIIKGCYETNKSHFYFLLNNHLLMIQHSFWHLHEYMNKRMVKANKEQIGFAKETARLLRLLYEAFYNKSISDFSKINSEMDRLIYGKAYRLFNDKKSDNVITYHLSEVIRNTNVACSSALGILVN